LRHEERGAKEVTVFMKNLQRFYTDTELGQDHLGLLFYPPSRSLKTKRTLGNATGRELQKENISMSVIECFPYAHQVSSNKFDQRMFRSLFENNESFQTAIKSYILENFRIEHEAFKIKHPDNHSKHALYLGGVVARVVFTQCYPTQEHEPTDAVSIPLLSTQCFANSCDMFYAMNGVHPSYHLMKGRDKRASECFRLNMAIFRALTIHAIENVPMNDTLTTEQAAKVREYNDVVDYIKSLNIDIDKVLHFRASCLHTTNVAQIKKAYIFVQANNIIDFKVFFHLSFSENFILVEDDKWKIILAGNSGEGDEYGWVLVQDFG
jgi:hypothetical protein